jgi:hypothetical protein
MFSVRDFDGGKSTPKYNKDEVHLGDGATDIELQIITLIIIL